MNKPTIDILMAVYNNEAYIIEQLESIFDQTYQNFHVYIRDDASTDRSLSLIEKFSNKYPDRIHIFKGNQNLGAKGNFSALLDISKADYIMLSDADDVWLPNKIEITLAEMHRCEEKYGKDKPILVHTDLRVVDKNLKTISESFWRYTGINPSKGSSLNQLLIQNSVTGCTMMINRSLLKLSRPVPDAAIMHDWWIGLVAVCFGHIAKIDEQTIFYRQHGKNDVGAKQGVSLRSPMSYMYAMKKMLDKDGRKDIRKRLKRTFDQAESFLILFSNDLRIDQKIVIEDFVSIDRSSQFKKRYIIIKNGFYKSGYAKNLGTFLFI